jgi:serine/threonine protein kinase
LALLARCTGADRGRLAALVPGKAGAALVPALVDAGVLDRVSARALGLVLAGSLDERDLKQLLDLPALRARLDRAARSSARSDVPAAPLPLPLDSLLGRYTIRGLLGRGGSGHVYRSVHPDLGIPVALKVSADAEPLRAEAAVLARITHRAVVRVWDVERAGRLAALVLEYVDGGGLGRALAGGDPLPAATVLRAARDVLAALTAVHAAGVVHGDVKPANVLGAAGSGFKLGDFGTARRSADPVPAGGLIHGTWPYAAPECFDGRGGPAADVYSLGLTLRHAATGRPDVTSTAFAECRAAHAAAALDPLHWTVPGVGRRVSDLVRRMTALDPADRPTASALLRAFRGVRPTPPTVLHPEAAR